MYLHCDWLIWFDTCGISFGQSNKVRTGYGKSGKSWNIKISFSRPGKSWKFLVSHGKPWKIIIINGRLIIAVVKARIK